MHLVKDFDFQVAFLTRSFKTFDFFISPMKIKIVKKNRLWNLLQINIVLEDVQGKKVALALHRSGQDVRQLVDSLPSEELDQFCQVKCVMKGLMGFYRDHTCLISFEASAVALKIQASSGISSPSCGIHLM